MEAKLAILNKGLITAADTLKLLLTTDDAVRGEARLRITWTDSYARTVADELRTLAADGSRVEFDMPLDRTLSVLNYLDVQLTVGQSVFTAPRTEFVITPEPNKLDDYNIIMYYGYPGYFPKLRELGITAGQIQPHLKIPGQITVADPAKVKPWVLNNYSYYCDQTAVPYYAAYHTPALEYRDKLLREAKELYRRDRTNKAAFIRHPSFHDEEATAEALERIRLTIEKHRQFKPIMYTTDECGVADLLTAWDFDFDPRTLTAMREWLLEQYGTLKAINEEWGTEFRSIDDVIPFTTDEMFERRELNLSPWADHRFFMNKAFADAVRKGTDTAHREDKDALSGIVGGQAPSTFGGYDYWLLSKSMDVIEPYNIGNNREILRSFSPDMPCLTTLFRYGEAEIWRLWHQALHGDRGIIIYNDDTNAYIDKEGNFTERAVGFKPSFTELTSGVVKQLAKGKIPKQQVSIHYSQSSMTAHWRIENEALGKDWLNYGSAHEFRDSTFLRLRESCVRIAEDNLCEYGFAAYGQLENGEFDHTDAKILILPQSVALSPAEVSAIRRFVERGGTVVADCLTGLMDNHCKLLDKGCLDELFGIERSRISFATEPGPEGLEPTGNLPGRLQWASALADILLEKVTTAEPCVKPAGDAVALYRDGNGVPAVIVNNCGAGKTVYLNLLITDYHRWRMKPPEHEGLRLLMNNLFKTAGAANEFTLTTEDGSHPHAVEQFTYEYGSMKLLAFLRNYQNRVTELGPPEYQDQSALQTEINLMLEANSEKALYDARKGIYLGKMSKVTFTLPMWEPVILTIMDEPVEELVINAPAEVLRGSLAEITASLTGIATGKFHTFRACIFDPDNQIMEYHTVNLTAQNGSALWRLPFAASDRPGTYTLKLRDYATGLSAEKTINIK